MRLRNVVLLISLATFILSVAELLQGSSDLQGIWRCVAVGSLYAGLLFARRERAKAMPASLVRITTAGSGITSDIGKRGNALH